MNVELTRRSFLKATLGGLFDGVISKETQNYPPRATLYWFYTTFQVPIIDEWTRSKIAEFSFVASYDQGKGPIPTTLTGVKKNGRDPVLISEDGWAEPFSGDLSMAALMMWSTLITETPFVNYVSTHIKLPLEPKDQVAVENILSSYTGVDTILEMNVSPIVTARAGLKNENKYTLDRSVAINWFDQEDNQVLEYNVQNNQLIIPATLVGASPHNLDASPVRREFLEIIDNYCPSEFWYLTDPNASYA